MAKHRPKSVKGTDLVLFATLIFLDHLEQNCRHNRHDSECQMETNHEIINVGCSKLEFNGGHAWPNTGPSLSICSVCA